MTSFFMAASLMVQTLAVVAVGEDCEVGCGGHEDHSTVLLQLTSAVQEEKGGGGAHAKGIGQRLPGGHPLQILPVARTFLSSNPAKSATFFAKYFNAQVTPLVLCDEGVEQAGVDIDVGLGSHVRYIFFKDETKLAGSLTPDELIHSVAASVIDEDPSPWINNHDGFLWSPTLFNVEKALADGVVLFAGGPVLQMYIPHTLWTLQLRQFPGEAYPQITQLDQETGRRLEPSTTCNSLRDQVPDPSETMSIAWQKATLMTADLQAAIDFATLVLGAEENPSPYPPTLQERCPEARWVTFKNIPFSLHFVKESPSLSFKVVMGAHQFAEHVENIRDLNANIFDEYMYNSLVFSVSSLDPYLLRIKHLELPYLLVRVNAEEVALYMDVPRNAIVFLLRSSHVSVAVPGDFASSNQSLSRACLQQFL